MRGAGRSGVLLIWLAIAGVVVLIFWGIARSFVTSSLRHEAAADVETSLVEVLAESAVAEAEARVGYMVNELDSAVAETLRRPVLAGESGEFDLSPFLVLTQTEALLATPGYRGYTVDNVTARVVFQKQIDSVPNEKRGLVLFSATVSSPGLVRRVSRRLELARWAKITHTTVPRPFGLFGLFLLNATGLTDVDTVNRGRERALVLCREVRTQVRTAGDAAGGTTKQSSDELLAETFDPDGTAPAPAPFELPDGGALYGLAESRLPQKLEHLDLGRRMTDLVDKAERAAAALSSLPPTADPAARLQVSRTALAAAAAPLLELWTFQRNYAAMAPGGSPEWSNLQAVTYKLTEDYFRRRAHYRLEDGPGRPRIEQQLKELFDNRVNGVVEVDNRSAPIDLTGTVHGRVVLVVGPGGANLRSVNASDQATGQLTVVCSSGPLRVSGKCVASLVLVDPPTGGGSSCTLSMEPDAQLHGSLIATGQPAGNWRTGELVRDERVFSGFTDAEGTEQGLSDHLFVGLSPRTFYRRLVSP